MFDLKKMFGSNAREIFTIDDCDFDDNAGYMTEEEEDDILEYALDHCDSQLIVDLQNKLLNELEQKDREGYILINPPFSDYAYAIQVVACKDTNTSGHTYFLLKYYRIDIYHGNDIPPCGSPQLWAIDESFNIASNVITNELVEIHKNMYVFI